MTLPDIEKKWLAGLLSDTEALDEVGAILEGNIKNQKALDLVSKILDMQEELPYSDCEE